jgi:tRNA dimethylallyltransferase
VILGPTAVGKTELSIQLAEILNGEIISADSRLFYRGMDIGTAKPSPEDQQRVPHHLIDVANPHEIWSLARFQEEAQAVISQINTRGRLPFLVGGTGQYIHAITHGWVIPKTDANPKLREALTTWGETIGPYELHRRLNFLDPDAANAIDPQNVRRTIRALEVILATGIRFSVQRTQKPCPYQVLQLGLISSRDELYQRVDQRIEHMIQNGFIEEVQGLIDNGYTPNLPTMSAIGYSEIARYLQGSLSLDDAMVLMKRRTRVFIRRQANWFKLDDPNIQWFTVSEYTLTDLQQAVVSWISTH